MELISFKAFAILSIVFWALGGIFLFISPGKSLYTLLGKILIPMGIGLFCIFLVDLWVSLERPPFRTLGETRLWYAVFLSAISFSVYLRNKYTWFVALGLSMSILFLIINLINPGNFDKTLMPALQSVWFIPHVIVYIFAYAILAGATLISIYATVFPSKAHEKDMVLLADNLVYMGFGFLTLGLLFGGLWAKEAWGHYWTWDPKETWSLITWLFYLVYIHIRLKNKKNIRLAYWTLNITFIILLICWFGVNYLPSARESIHIYAG